MKVVGMKMDEIEMVRVAQQLLEHHEVMRQGILARGIEPQRLWSCRDEPCLGHRVASGEQSDLMSARNELLGEIGDDPLGSSVELRRHALEQRSDLSHTHPDNS